MPGPGSSRAQDSSGAGGMPPLRRPGARRTRCRPVAAGHAAAAARTGPPAIAGRPPPPLTRPPTPPLTPPLRSLPAGRRAGPRGRLPRHPDLRAGRRVRPRRCPGPVRAGSQPRRPAADVDPRPGHPAGGPDREHGRPRDGRGRAPGPGRLRRPRGQGIIRQPDGKCPAGDGVLLFAPFHRQSRIAGYVPVGYDPDARAAFCRAVPARVDSGLPRGIRGIPVAAGPGSSQIRGKGTSILPRSSARCSIPPRTSAEAPGREEAEAAWHGALEYAARTMRTAADADARDYPAWWVGEIVAHDRRTEAWPS